MKDKQQLQTRLDQATAALKAAIDETTDIDADVPSEKAGETPTPANEKPDGGSKRVKQPKTTLGTNRGIETMFRSVYRVQMDLTGLADNKANMMISINGIIISIIIASVAPKLDSNPWLLIPATLFLIGTLISIIYSILAARPRVSSQPIDLEDLRHSKGNILFFGNFSRMPESEFIQGITSLVQDKTILYESMMRDVYGLGQVLQKKFALLRVAYTCFMVALILGVTSFISVFVWILLQKT